MNVLIKIILMVIIDIVFVWWIFKAFYAIGESTSLPILCLLIALIISIIFIFIIYMAFFHYPTLSKATMAINHSVNKTFLSIKIT